MCCNAAVISKGSDKIKQLTKVVRTVGYYGGGGVLCRIQWEEQAGSEAWKQIETWKRGSNKWFRTLAWKRLPNWITGES